MESNNPASKRIKTLFLCVFVLLWLAPVTLDGRDVPVISAMTTPVKVRPIDPGGMEIPYQGIIVMNPSLTAEPEQTVNLMPSPEEPMAP
jgi:hypothetical protein